MGQLNRQVIMKDRGRTVIHCGHTGKRSRGPVSGYVVSHPNIPSGPDMKFRFKRRQEERMGKRSLAGCGAARHSPVPVSVPVSAAR